MKSNHGQALVEYLLIIAVVSLIAIGIIRLVGGYVKDALTKSSCELLGNSYVEGDAPGKARCEE